MSLEHGARHVHRAFDDPEAAVASGAVSPAEMHAVAEALEAGSLEQWVTEATRTVRG